MRMWLIQKLKWFLSCRFSECKISRENVAGLQCGLRKPWWRWHACLQLCPFKQCSPLLPWHPFMLLMNDGWGAFSPSHEQYTTGHTGRVTLLHVPSLWRRQLAHFISTLTVFVYSPHEFLLAGRFIQCVERCYKFGCYVINDGNGDARSNGRNSSRMSI